MNAQMRKDALRRYVVFRMKLAEFHDLMVLYMSISNGKCLDPASVRQPLQLQTSLRTVAISFFALFIEKNKDGLDVIPLWKCLFPCIADEIDATVERMAPGLQVIRAFRDKAGFHADRPGAFFAARYDLLTDPTALAAADLFLELCIRIVRLEPVELPDLGETLEELLDDLDQQHPERTADRQVFKAYLMM
jgi:hypothetical protein